MQIEHKTEKGTVVFVKAQNDATNIHISNFYNPMLSYKTCSSLHFIEVKLPYDDLKLIGLTSEITEEQAKMIGLASVSNFRKEIEKLQVYEVNPLDKPNRYLACKLHPLECTGDEINRCRKYEEAQSGTGKWIVLFKPND